MTRDFDDLVIEKMTEKDVEFVCKLETDLIGKASKDKIYSSLKSDVLTYFVLKKNDKIIGFFECQIIAPEAELFDIAISLEMQGKGYGSFMMNYFLDHCKANGCDTIFLEVNSINSKAIKLYEKFGFSSYGTRKNYYGENDAVLMKCEF